MNDDRSMSRVPHVSLAPLLLPDVSDVAPEVARIRAEAERRGFGALADRLGQAERECRHLARIGADDRQAREADPGQLWRPVERR